MREYAEAAIIGIRAIAKKLENMAEQNPDLLDKPFEIRILDRHIEGRTQREVHTDVGGASMGVVTILPRIKE